MLPRYIGRGIAKRHHSGPQQIPDSPQSLENGRNLHGGDWDGYSVASEARIRNQHHEVRVIPVRGNSVRPRAFPTTPLRPSLSGTFDRFYRMRPSPASR